MAGTATVGYTVSSPYYNPGTVINSGTGAVIKAAPGPLPIPQAQPAQPASQPTGRDPHINPATGVWDDTYYATHFGNSGGGQSAPSIDFDALYQPVFDSLNNQRNLTDSVYQSTLGSIDAQSGAAKGNVDTQVQGADAQYGNDQSQLGSEQNSAWAQAAKTYSQLQEQMLQRFGYQSSAGLGANELLGQSLLETQGNIGQAYSKSLGDLLTQNQQVHFWAAQQKSQIDADTQTNKDKAYAAYAGSIQSINNDDTATRLAKVQQQVNAAQQLQQQINAIDAYASQKAIDLQTWTQQQNYALQQQGQALAQAHAQFIGSNPFANTNTVNQYVPAPQQQQTYDSSYYAPTKKDDPFSGVIA